MKVFIDREQCIGCSICWSQCPEVFEEDEKDSWSRIVEGFRVAGDKAKGEAPENLRESAQGAADSCPVAIIRIE
jgi:ferredoxin